MSSYPAHLVEQEEQVHVDDELFSRSRYCHVEDVQVLSVLVGRELFEGEIARARDEIIGEDHDGKLETLGFVRRGKDDFYVRR